MSSSFFERPHKKRDTAGIERVTPILNVSNIQESFAWFEKLGWKKAWDWGDPPDFGRHPDGHVLRIGQGRE
jgi:hypothetical protein